MRIGPLHVMTQPIDDGGQSGSLVLVHDMSFVERRSADTRRYIYYLFALITAPISAVTVIIAQLSWRGWIAAVRGFLQGEGPFMPLPQPDHAGAPAARRRS